MRRPGDIHRERTAGQGGPWSSEGRAVSPREARRLLSDVRTAIEQVDGGRAIPNRDAKAELRRRFRR